MKDSVKRQRPTGVRRDEEEVPRVGPLLPLEGKDAVGEAARPGDEVEHTVPKPGILSRAAESADRAYGRQVSIFLFYQRNYPRHETRIRSTCELKLVESKRSLGQSDPTKQSSSKNPNYPFQTLK